MIWQEFCRFRAPSSVIPVELRNGNCGPTVLQESAAPNSKASPPPPILWHEPISLNFTTCPNLVGMWVYDLDGLSLVVTDKLPQPRVVLPLSFLNSIHLNFHNICLAFQTCPVAGYFFLGVGAPFRNVSHLARALSVLPQGSAPGWHLGHSGRLFVPWKGETGPWSAGMEVPLGWGVRMGGIAPAHPAYAAWREQFSQTGSWCSTHGEDPALLGLAASGLRSGGCSYGRLAQFLTPRPAAQRTLQKCGLRWYLKKDLGDCWLDCLIACSFRSFDI